MGTFRGPLLGASLIISLHILIQPYLYKHFAKQIRTYQLIMRRPLNRVSLLSAAELLRVHGVEAVPEHGVGAAAPLPGELAAPVNQ